MVTLPLGQMRRAGALRGENGPRAREIPQTGMSPGQQIFVWGSPTNEIRWQEPRSPWRSGVSERASPTVPPSGRHELIEPALESEVTMVATYR